MKLSVVIPVYNEKDTLETLVDRVLQSPVDIHEILIVDDCSTDGTRDIIKQKINHPNSRCFFHEKNRGKGASVRTGFANATGDVVVVQDADCRPSRKRFIRNRRDGLWNKIRIVSWLPRWRP